jgi:NAD(P)-dependent dehydrogenase (short-subunit alcohol dehydrogenase family)
MNGHDSIDAHGATVLITGASSGVGQSTARFLAESGYRVFGTSRHPVGARAIPGMQMLILDVCSDDSVSACVKEVVNQVGRLDVLINNAAYELAGAVEEVSLEEAKSQFDTNFFGVVRMTRAVLPLMRQRKQGRIINISSFSGVSAIPFLGVYSASKAALEGYTDALRMEVRPFNIQVSVTEAGFLKTPMMDKRLVAATTIGDYDPWRQRAFRRIRELEESAPGPDLVARTIREILASARPRFRYLIGPQARNTSRLRWLLPETLYENGKRKVFRLDG